DRAPRPPLGSLHSFVITNPPLARLDDHDIQHATIARRSLAMGSHLPRECRLFRCCRTQRQFNFATERRDKRPEPIAVVRLWLALPNMQIDLLARRRERRHFRMRPELP